MTSKNHQGWEISLIDMITWNTNSCIWYHGDLQIYSLPRCWPPGHVFEGGSAV